MVCCLEEAGFMTNDESKEDRLVEKQSVHSDEHQAESLHPDAGDEERDCSVDETASFLS